jgi:hypothetical protein
LRDRWSISARVGAPTLNVYRPWPHEPMKLLSQTACVPWISEIAARIEEML